MLSAGLSLLLDHRIINTVQQTPLTKRCNKQLLAVQKHTFFIVLTQNDIGKNVVE